jgi:hypothetical protein
MNTPISPFRVHLESMALKERRGTEEALARLVTVVLLDRLEEQEALVHRDPKDREEQL